MDSNNKRIIVILFFVFTFINFYDTINIVVDKFWIPWGIVLSYFIFHMILKVHGK